MSATTAQQVVLDAVEGAGFPAPFKELIILALSQPGRILDTDHPSLFHEIISACSLASGGHPNFAAVAGAAFELCIAASDILDEIEDGDESVVVTRGGMPRALNASTALLTLAYSVLSGAASTGDESALFLRLSRELSDTIVASTIGQDADLSTAGGNERSIELALDIARSKSGSLVSGASVMGAMLGTLDPDVIALYRQFGLHLGTAYQLNNDQRDARSSIKSDVSSEKGTVPLVFQRNGAVDSVDASDQSSLRSSGALQFTWVLMETERNACKRVIEALRQHDQDVTPLYRLASEQ